MWLILLHAPPAPFVPEQWHGRKICAMAVCYSGDLDAIDAVLAPIRALGDPVVDLLEEQPYTQVQSYLDDDRAQGQSLLLEDRVRRRAERRAPVDHAGPVRRVPHPRSGAGLPAPRRGAQRA